MKFFEAYNDVFDSEDKVKVCGREACIKLIKICNKISPNMDYGSVNTGFINVENVVNLKNTLCKFVLEG